MCSVCASKAAGVNKSANKKKSVVKNIEAIEAENADCRFDNETLIYLRDELGWYKSSGLYKQYGTTAKELTRYRGITISALNTSRKCFYEKELSIIEDLVVFIITLK